MWKIIIISLFLISCDNDLLIECKNDCVSVLHSNASADIGRNWYFYSETNSQTIYVENFDRRSDSKVVCCCKIKKSDNDLVKYVWKVENKGCPVNLPVEQMSFTK